MKEFDVFGGETKGTVAARLVAHANDTGESCCALFGNIYMMANPGATVEAVTNRFDEDLGAKSDWFRSPQGVAFIQARKAGVGREYFKLQPPSLHIRIADLARWLVGQSATRQRPVSVDKNGWLMKASPGEDAATVSARYDVDRGMPRT